MRIFISTIVSLLFFIVSVQAQDIVGKWYCSNEFLDSLGVSSYYDDLSGSIEFNKDATFVLRIEGSGLVSRSSAFTEKAWGTPLHRRRKTRYRNLFVRVKGTFCVESGRVTTTVVPQDVICYVGSGRKSQNLSDVEDDEFEMKWKLFQQSAYENAESNAERMANTIKTERKHLWEWNNEHIMVTDDSLLVGNGKKFIKKRGGSWGDYMAKLYSRPHRYSKRLNKTAGRAIEVIQQWEKNTEKKKRWAVKTLEKETAQDSVSYFMFYLGLAYMDGIGTEKDTAKAVVLMEKAGAVGYVRAYHVLGMRYKQGNSGVCQDFGRAYECFSRGAELSSTICQYAKGYMLYKGLGCKQNYQDAARSFLSAANDRDAKSWYMLGLCSRNGYGLVKDTAAATFCLKRAARMHCKEAKEELARSHEETYMHETYLDDERYSFIPDTMPDVRPSVADSILTDGSYSGFIVTYDWSGKYILDEQPLSMTVSRADGELSGTLTVGKDEVSYRGTLSGGRLVFSDGNVTLPERYVRGGKMDYELDSMALDATDGKIRGRLNLYSAKLKEPGRPMYMELRRVGYNGI